MNNFKFRRHLLFTIFFVINFNLAWSQNDFTLIDKTVKFGMRHAENRKINAVIVHSTFNNAGGEKYDIELVIKQFSHYKVCSHYIIGRDGNVYYLVNEKNVAIHAGKSQLPNGKRNINANSIGIELLTSFDEAPTKEQIKSLTFLVNDIKNRFNIEYVLRHSDIAPDRKTDPWNMDWEAFLKGIDP